VMTGLFPDNPFRWAIRNLHHRLPAPPAMKPRSPIRPSILLTLLLSMTWVTGLEAQLAITEVHSNQSTNGTPAIHADWFEVTHYGSAPVDLRGWRLNDSNGGTTNGAVTLAPLTLSPGESVVFVQDLDATAFRSWWGPSLPASVQIVTYSASGIGLSSTGDGLRLWDAAAGPDSAPQISVDFGAAGTNSATFVTDPRSGLLTARATAGNPGAFAAADGGDIGSPGVAGPAITLSIAVPPADRTVNPGDSTTFTVEAAGLPRPRYQWLFNGTALTGQNGPSLSLTNVQAASSGLYSVALDNGLQTLTSPPARLSIAAAPTAPRWVQTPGDTSVLEGGSLTLAATASGVPEPTYQWSLDGRPIAGATGTTLSLTALTPAQAGAYSVIASNASGSVTHTVTLSVLGRPQIRITEVSSARTTLDPGFIDRMGFAPEDWWEITSFSPAPISLTGWRFDDNSASLASAITLTDTNLVILPGESIVFVERLTADQFRTWWGASNLPPGLKIVSYTGSGIGLSSGGDGLRLWNATATANADTIDGVDFPAGDPGISFNFDPDTREFGKPSALDVHGTVQAVATLEGVKEWGSPGRIRAGDTERPPTSPRLAAVLAEGALRISLQAEASRTYRLQRRNAADGSWSTVGASQTATADGPISFTVPLPAEGESAGLFRVEVP